MFYRKCFKGGGGSTAHAQDGTIEPRRVPDVCHSWRMAELVHL